MWTYLNYKKNRVDKGFHLVNANITLDKDNQVRVNTQVSCINIDGKSSVILHSAKYQ